MARMNSEELKAAATDTLGATIDPSGAADLLYGEGSMVVAGEAGEMKAAFKRIKKGNGYRWVMINRDDLFAANGLSIGSKAGLITPDGTVLKAADLPRRKV